MLLCYIMLFARYKLSSKKVNSAVVIYCYGFLQYCYEIDPI